MKNKEYHKWRWPDPNLWYPYEQEVQYERCRRMIMNMTKKMKKRKEKVKRCKKRWRDIYGR